MSGGQDYYNPPQGNSHHFQSNNPFQQSQQEQDAWQQQPAGNSPAGMDPAQQGYSQPQGYSEPHGHQGQSYDAPPGPPPGQTSGHVPSGQAQPRHTDTFKESDFVPADERGEQREAMEQFEMSKGHQSQEDRDMETLQQEFPSIDGSLVAALYSDSKSLSGTREMLSELGGQS